MLYRPQCSPFSLVSHQRRNILEEKSLSTNSVLLSNSYFCFSILNFPICTMDVFTLPLTWEEDHPGWHVKASTQHKAHCLFPPHVFSTELNEDRKLLSTLASLCEWLFPRWRRRHTLSFRKLGGCWESICRPCWPPTHSSNWQVNYRSMFCALILPRHLHWPGAIFQGQRMASFLSYHNHLGLSVWCVPCLIPLPGLPVLLPT